MSMSAPTAGWITNDAFPGVRAHVSPVPSDAAALAILGALHDRTARAPASSRGARPSAWRRSDLAESAGTGDAWMSHA